MKKQRRYKHTKVRDKQSIIRSLNTFSKQYEYIYTEDIEVDLNCEPLSLYYKDDEIDNELYKIYSNRDSTINLKDYTLICEAVDSLFGIGPSKWKEELKDKIRLCSSGQINYFLSSKFEDEAKNIIAEVSTNPKIYNYLKNYTKYFNSGIYQLNKNHKLIMLPINSIESLEKQLRYLHQAKQEYTRILKEIKDEYDDLTKTFQKWEENSNYDSDAIHEGNSSYFHPIDDSEQSETLWITQRREQGLYEEEALDKLHNWGNNIAELQKKLQISLKPLEYAFDIHFNFNFDGMKSFQHFRDDGFYKSSIYKIAKSFQEELLQLLENSEHYNNEHKLFLQLLNNNEDEYTKDWVIEELSRWENLLANSKYTHKSREVATEIKKELSSDNVREAFDRLYVCRMSILSSEQEHTNKINNILSKLDNILESEEDKEANFGLLVEKCKDALTNKSDDTISDAEYLMRLDLIEDEDEWYNIFMYIQEEDEKSREMLDKNHLGFIELYESGLEIG